MKINVTWIMQLIFLSFADFTIKSKTISEWTHWKTCHGKTQMGNGIQRLFGISGWLHEFTGITLFNSPSYYVLRGSLTVEFPKLLSAWKQKILFYLFLQLFFFHSWLIQKNTLMVAALETLGKCSSGKKSSGLFSFILLSEY